MDPLGKKYLYNEVTKEIFINPQKPSGLQTEYFQKDPAKVNKTNTRQDFCKSVAVSQGTIPILVSPYTGTHACTHMLHPSLWLTCCCFQLPTPPVFPIKTGKEK
jgi:hypothetical protein